MENEMNRQSVNSDQQFHALLADFACAPSAERKQLLVAYLDSRATLEAAPVAQPLAGQDVRAVTELARQAVATVVSKHGSDLRVGWLRLERCEVGTLLYTALEQQSAQPSIPQA